MDELRQSFESIRDKLKDLFNRVNQLEAAPTTTSGSGGGAPVDAQYLTLAFNAILTNERRLDLSARFATVDGGAGSDYDVDLAASGVGAGVYGSATQVSQITVDAYGRLTNATNVAITGTPPGSHSLLNDVYHGDTVTNVATRGSLIYGNATPLWDELTLGGIIGSVLTRNATDALWSAGALSFAGAFTLTIPANGTAVLGTGTTGYVAYWNGTNAITGEAQLFYDFANNRLGVGDPAPVSAISILSTTLPQLRIAHDANVAMLLSSDLVTTTYENLISSSTTDGADDSVLRLCGGGAANSNRGAYIEIYGNEYSQWAPAIASIVLQTGIGGDLYLFSLDDVFLSCDTFEISLGDALGVEKVIMENTLGTVCTIDSLGTIMSDSLTASTVIYSDASKEIVSLANGAGYLTNNGAGVLSWSASTTPSAHNLLSASHGDTTAQAVSRGSLIYGDSTPKWNELVLGGITGSVLTRNATDALWSAGALSFAGAFTLTIPANGTAVLGTGTTGYVAYWNGTNAITGEAQLFYDFANNRLGINDATPSYTLDVNGIIGINGVQTVYNADAFGVFRGTLYFGNGGASLLSVGGNDGCYNTMVGYNAGLAITTGWGNNAIGYNAMAATTFGQLNTALGHWAMTLNVDGDENVAIGVSALNDNVSSNYNCALGSNALYNTTAAGNTGIGHRAGNSNETGTYSVYIGYLTEPDDIAQTNQIVIGANAVGNGSNTTTIGHTDITDCYIRGNIIVENTHFVGITSDVRTAYDSTNGRINETLGDAAGADEWRVIDSGGVPVSTTDSDGNGTMAATFNIGARTDTHGISPSLMSLDYVQVTNSITRHFMDSYNATAEGSQVIGFHARGTQAAPTATQANDGLLYLRGAGGYETGGVWTALTGSRARIDMFAAEAYTNLAQGAYIDIYTTPVGSVTPARSMRLNSTGNILIGTTTDGLTAAGSIAIAKDLAHRGANAGFYNVAPIARPTTASAAAVFAANAGTAINDASTFDGYTLKQVVKALRDLGLLT